MKRSAFTLAEILVTLAIIGVVAALTIPTLINNYQRKVLETKFKKTYAEIGVLFKTIMGMDGVTTLYQTSIYEGCGDSCHNRQLDLSKYIKLTRFNENYNFHDFFGGGDNEIRCATSYCFMNAAGILYEMDATMTKPASVGGKPYIDVLADLNGPQLPNALGKDIFGFRVDNNGIVYAYGQAGIPYRTDTIDAAQLALCIASENDVRDLYDGGLGGDEWSNASELEKESIVKETMESLKMQDNTMNGWGCGLRIIEDGAITYY